MEFLKDILGEDLYKQVSDTVNAYNGKPENKDKQVKLADLGSGQYVDKGKYDTAVAEKENLAGQIKTLNTTIGDLKKNNADNETLQNTIADLQTKLKDQQTANDRISKTYALKDSLTKQGVLDPDYLIYKAGGLDKFTFDKEGKPVGVEEVETIGAVQAPVARGEQLHLAHRIVAANLGDGEAAAIFVG